jgi:hypothetical protein
MAAGIPGFDCFEPLGGAPEAGLRPSGAHVNLPTRGTLLAFDLWFYSGWRDL